MQNVASQSIAVVDDDGAFRKAALNLLKACGFSAEGFSSAEEFLDAPHWSETGCLILDIQMPGMSGLELQGYLARANRLIPIIFITARGCEESRKQAMHAGASDFLPKPFSEETLLRALHKALT